MTIRNFRVGGIRFLRLGRLQITVSRVRAHTHVGPVPREAFAQ